MHSGVFTDVSLAVNANIVSNRQPYSGAENVHVSSVVHLTWHGNMGCGCCTISQYQWHHPLRPENRCGVWPWSPRGPTGGELSAVGCRDVGGGSVKQKRVESVGWKGENYAWSRSIYSWFWRIFFNLMMDLSIYVHLISWSSLQDVQDVQDVQDGKFIDVSFFDSVWGPFASHMKLPEVQPTRRSFPPRLFSNA